jgi:hypothetical protein
MGPPGLGHVGQIEPARAASGLRNSRNVTAILRPPVLDKVQNSARFFRAKFRAAPLPVNRIHHVHELDARIIPRGGWALVWLGLSGGKPMQTALHAE